MRRKRYLTLAGIIVFVVILLFFMVYTTKYKNYFSNKRSDSLEIGSISKSDNSDKLNNVSNKQTAQVQSKQSSHISPKQTNEKYGDIEADKTEALKPETSAKTGTSVVETGSSGISPELEKMFVKYKEFVDQNLPITRASAHLNYRFSELSKREDKLWDDLLVLRGEDYKAAEKELQQVRQEKSAVGDALSPYKQLSDQLAKKYDEYFQANYGMTLLEFKETYGEKFKAWWKKNGYEVYWTEDDEEQ